MCKAEGIIMPTHTINLYGKDGYKCGRPGGGGGLRFSDRPEQRERGV